jgi:hypothetical protein
VKLEAVRLGVPFPDALDRLLDVRVQVPLSPETLKQLKMPPKYERRRDRGPNGK